LIDLNKPSISLKISASSGIKWISLSSVITSFLYIIEMGILAHLLSPEDFGLMAMIMVIIGFAQAYADMGISNAIIQRQDTTENQLSSLYWLNIFTGVMVCASVIAITPIIIEFYHEPRLKNLICWSALVFLITPLGQQFQILLQKNFKFFQLSIIETLATIVGVGIAIGCALNSFGVYSLILGRLSQQTVKMFMLVGSSWKKWRPSLHFSRTDLTGYLGFGLYQMGERSINYFNANLDQLLIGALVGAEALGHYNLAFNLVILPIAKINPILTRVAFPVFAKIQFDNNRLKRGYLLVIRVLSLINFPLLLGLAATAPIFIPVVFGNEWIPATKVVVILAFVALLRSTGNPLGSLLLAKGRADLGFKLNAVKLIVHIPGIYIGAHFGGMVGVAIMLLFLQILYSTLGDCLMVKIILGPCLREYLMSMIPAFILSAAMSIPVWLITILMSQPELHFLIFQIMVGVTIYLMMNLLFQRRKLHELKEMIFDR